MHNFYRNVCLRAPGSCERQGINSPTEKNLCIQNWYSTENSEILCISVPLCLFWRFNWKHTRNLHKGSLSPQWFSCRPVKATVVMTQDRFLNWAAPKVTANLNWSIDTSESPSWSLLTCLSCQTAFLRELNMSLRSSNTNQLMIINRYLEFTDLLHIRGCNPRAGILYMNTAPLRYFSPRHLSHLVHTQQPITSA